MAAPRTAVTLLCLCVLTALLPAQRPGPQPTLYALTGARVVTAAGQEPVAATVVIRDGLIQAVGDKVAVPPGALVIDGSGLIVYPGFVDAGSTWGIDLALRRSEAGPPEPVDYAAEALAATKADNRKGVTPEFEVATALQVTEETADAWRKQGITARLAFPEGGPIAGQSALVSLSGAVPREAVLRSPVALHAMLRAGGFGGGYPSTLMGVMAHVRQALLDAGWHARRQEAFERQGIGKRPPLDPALDALQPALHRKQPVVMEANTRDEIHRALDLAAEYHLQPIILGGAEAWKVADRLLAEKVPVLLTLNFIEQPTGPLGRRGGGPRRAPELPPGNPGTPAVPVPNRRQPPADPTLALETPSGDEPDRKPPQRVQQDNERKQKEDVRCAAELHKKGVPFAFISSGLDKPERFRENLAKVVKEGLPADAALKALTGEAARILGAEKYLGTIAVGKTAHLVAMTAPFTDPKCQVRFVFADGGKFEYDPPKAEDKDAPPLSGKPKAPPPDLDTLKKQLAERDIEKRQAEADLKRADLNLELAKKTLEGAATEQARTDAKVAVAKAQADKDKAEAALRGAANQANVIKDQLARAEEKSTDKSAKPAGPEQATEIEADRKPQLRTGGNVLIKNATLLPVTGPAAEGDLLVKDGKIAAIGKDVMAPEGIATIDGKGLWVMPGIIDTHSHFAMTGGVNEATLSVVPEVRVKDIVNGDDTQIYRGLAGGVATARLLHGSANVIGGQDAVIKMKYGQPGRDLIVTDGPQGVKFALGENVKRTDGRFPNTRLGVEAVLVRAFTEAQEYKRVWYEYKKALAEGKPEPEPRRDLRLEALANILDGKILVHCHCYRADEILMLLRVADRFGVKIKSLQHVLEGYKIAAEIAAHGASCSTFADWWAYKIEAYDAIPYNTALLKEAGVEPVFKSDSNELMRHLYQEAAKAMKYGGMTEQEALAAITINGAKQLGLEKRIGSLEVGKDADLAIFTAHPLNSYARVEMALVEGEVYFQRHGGTARVELPAWTPPTEKRGPGVPVLKIPRSPVGKYLLSGATVHPVAGPVLPNSVVLVEDGKVKAIGKEVGEIPLGTTMVDARGLHLYPGMIDAASVIGLTELGSARETQDFQEGGDYQPDLRAATGINPDSELIPVTRANGVLTVVTRPGGATVAGQSALLNLFGWVPSDLVMVDPLALHIEFPAAVPVFSGDPTNPLLGRALARKQREEKLRRTRELFRQAAAYANGRVPGQAVDPRLEALVPYAKGEKPVIIQANRKEEILEALKFADELKLKIILTGALDAWKVADDLKKRDVAVILGPVMILPQETYDPYDATFACAAKLHQAGVRFCVRSGGSTNTRNLPYEAAMAVSYGLPAAEGLKAVTLYPAQILGVAEKLGSIETGKLANLVLTDGDLLQATTQVRALFINGVPLEPTSKQTRLYERYRVRLEEVKEGKAKLGTK